MNASAFASYLSKKLTDGVEAIENAILSCSFKEIEQLHRSAGSRDILKEVVSKMESILDEFLKSDSDSSSRSGE